MPEPPAHLYFDEDVSVVVAAILRARGFEVVTTRESGRLGLPDAEQLAFAAGAGRALLTHNRFEHTVDIEPEAGAVSSLSH